MQSLEAACEEADHILHTAKRQPHTVPHPKTVDREKHEDAFYNIHQQLRQLYEEECVWDFNQPNNNHLKFSSHLVDKLVARDKLNTLIVNLYPGNKGYSLGYRINNEESETMRWPYSDDELLKCLDQQEIPVMLVDLIEESINQLFYSGCLVAEIRDYRQAFPVQGMTKYHVLLRPTTRSLITDVNRLTLNGDWSPDERLQLESQLVLATQAPLCLDPSPSVAISNRRLQLESQPFSTRPLQRTARKMTQVSLNRKRKLDQFSAHHDLKLYDFLARRRPKPKPTTAPVPKRVVNPELSLPEGVGVDIAKMRRPLDRPQQTNDCTPHLVEEYVLETERGQGRVYHIKLTILQRAADGQFLGELYVDRDHREGEKNGSACRFPLGNRAHANRYIHQFTEIFTEEGRKSVRITHLVPGHPPRVTCTSGMRERDQANKLQAQLHAQLQQQLQQQAQNHQQITQQAVNCQPLQTAPSPQPSILRIPVSQVPQVHCSQPMVSQLLSTQPITTHLLNSQSIQTHILNTQPITTQFLNSQPITTHLLNSQPITTHILNTQPITTQLLNTPPIGTQLLTQPMNNQLSNSHSVPLQVQNSQPLVSQLNSHLLLTSQPNSLLSPPMVMTNGTAASPKSPASPTRQRTNTPSPRHHITNPTISAIVTSLMNSAQQFQQATQAAAAAAAAAASPNTPGASQVQQIPAPSNNSTILSILNSNNNNNNINHGQVQVQQTNSNPQKVVPRKMTITNLLNSGLLNSNNVGNHLQPHVRVTLSQLASQLAAPPSTTVSSLPQFAVSTNTLTSGFASVPVVGKSPTKQSSNSRRTSADPPGNLGLSMPGLSALLAGTPSADNPIPGNSNSTLLDRLTASSTTSNSPSGYSNPSPSPKGAGQFPLSPATSSPLSSPPTPSVNLNLQRLNCIESLQGTLTSLPGLQNVQVTIPGLAVPISVSLNVSTGGAVTASANQNQSVVLTSTTSGQPVLTVAQLMASGVKGLNPQNLRSSIPNASISLPQAGPALQLVGAVQRGRGLLQSNHLSNERKLQLLQRAPFNMAANNSATAGTGPNQIVKLNPQQQLQLAAMQKQKSQLQQLQCLNQPQPSAVATKHRRRSNAADPHK